MRIIKFRIPTMPSGARPAAGGTKPDGESKSKLGTQPLLQSLRCAVNVCVQLVGALDGFSPTAFVTRARCAPNADASSTRWAAVT